MFKNSVRTSKRTQPITDTDIYTKSINTKRRVTDLKVAGTYSYHLKITQKTEAVYILGVHDTLLYSKCQSYNICGRRGYQSVSH
jgi:hypothetical protein